MIFTFEDILITISTQGPQKLKLENQSYLEYVIKLLDFMETNFDRSKIVKLLNQYKILLNQNNEAADYDNLKNDCCQNLILKKFVEMLGFQVSKCLIHKELNDHLRTNSSVTDEDLMREVIEKVSSLEAELNPTKNKKYNPQPYYYQPYNYQSYNYSLKSTDAKLIPDLDWKKKTNKRIIKSIIEKVLLYKTKDNDVALDWYRKSRKLSEKPQQEPMWRGNIDDRELINKIKDICDFWAWRKVNNCKTLNCLEKKLTFEKPEELFKWLNEFYKKWRDTKFDYVLIYNQLGNSAVYRGGKTDLKLENFSLELERPVSKHYNQEAQKQKEPKDTTILKSDYKEQDPITILKEIYQKLFKKSINDILLHKSIEFFPIEEYKMTNICSEIDNEFKKKREFLKSQGEVKATFHLIIEKLNPETPFFKEYFPFLCENISSLLLESMGNKNSQTTVFKILNSGQTEKYLELAEKNLKGDELQLLINTDIDFLKTTVGKEEEIKDFLKTSSEQKNFLQIILQNENGVADELIQSMKNERQRDLEMAKRFNDIDDRQENLRAQRDRNYLAQFSFSSQAKFREASNYHPYILSSMRNYQSYVSADAFKYVKTIYQRSLDRIISELKKVSAYDLSKISFTGPYDNIIHGIRKYGQEIDILVRPADFGSIFIDDFDEISLLKKPSCELWLDDGAKVFQLTIGDILHKNQLKKVLV